MNFKLNESNVKNIFRKTKFLKNSYKKRQFYSLSIQIPIKLVVIFSFFNILNILKSINFFLFSYQKYTFSESKITY